MFAFIIFGLINFKSTSNVINKSLAVINGPNL
jgi:hypothetical protein